MKKTLLFGKLCILLLSIPLFAMAQYTGSYPNVASLKKATALDSIAGFEPSKSVDMSLTTYCAVSEDAPAWLQIDLGAFYFIDGYEMVLQRTGELPTTYTFQVSEDGINWYNRGTEMISTTGTYSYDIPVLGSNRYVRFYITDKDAQASFSEISVFGYVEEIPSSPPVAEAATDISPVEFTAHWSKRSTATGYILTVATDRPAFNNTVPGYEDLDVGEVLEYVVSGLSPNMTYYYHVKAYNNTGSTGWSNTATVITLNSQTITFNSIPAKIYGATTFDLDGTASSGLPVEYSSSDESVATISGNTVSIIGAGTTTITASQEGNLEYDAATPVPQDLVVNPKELMVSGAMVGNKPYDGTPIAVVSGAILEGVVGGDDVLLIGSDAGTFSQSNAGTGIEVTISMSLSGADIGNYNLSPPVGLTGDIYPKDLLVMAEDKSRDECEENPEFTILYTGFISTEDESNLDTEPIATCDADQNSPSGDYIISVGAGVATNYVFVYSDGTLTIAPDSFNPLLAVQNITILLDDTGNASITPADLVIGATDNCGVTDTILSQSIFTVNDIGDLEVVVSVFDAAGNSAMDTAVVTVEASSVGIRAMSGIKANLYPNPTKDKITLVLDTPVDDLRVIDITGKRIITMKNLRSQESIDLSGYSNGVYFFQLQSGHEVKYFKVIKE